ncbi:MAG: DinB family protein [Sciscionella sp.]|nr:DinB family protein [Sciscionella sp.]
MTENAQPQRVDPPMTGDERTQLTTFLTYQRQTVLWKCSGLTDEQARRSFYPSELTTIAGLLCHLRGVEEGWFAVALDGQPDPWAERIKADPDAEFRHGMRTPIGQLIDEYQRECQRGDEIVGKLDLDQRLPFRDREITPRWVLIHMIEETARHAGHIDLIREQLDGLVGE